MGRHGGHRLVANIVGAFGQVLDPLVLGVVLASALFGLFVGAIPGLTATMAVALLVPVTFSCHRYRRWRPW